MSHPSHTAVPVTGRRPVGRALGAPLGVVALGVAGCVAVWLADPTTPGGPLPVCPTKALFGIDCPGCGGLRMVYSLLHGDIPAALHYNAVSAVGVLLFGWSFAAWTYGRLRARPVRSWLHWRWTPLVSAIVVAVWFVIRNLPFAPFDALYV